MVSKDKCRVVVAMSGGVDSSVAAALLCEAGHEVIGVSMKFWSKEFCLFGKPKSCCSSVDLTDARSVAGRLGIPFYAFDLSKEFKEEVIDYFCREYANGRTPNPCIICNNVMKFGLLLKKAKLLGADYIATGHYADVKYDDKRKRFILSQPKDESKDQSYVLFGLTQEQLGAIIFPLGKYLKKDVREIAKRLGLKVSEKPESQEICFVWDDDYPQFLIKYYGIRPQPGEITTQQGKVLGRHPGIIFYTIGQRKGLGLGGGRRPLYVVDIDAKTNRVMVGPRESLKKKTLLADGLNWIGIEKLTKPVRLRVKIRYNHPEADAVICPITSQPRRSGEVKVVFDEPQAAITPGQAVVFYKGDEVVGGGWIKTETVSDPTS